MSEIPRWLELQYEIDYRLWLLNEMRRELATEDARATPLDRLIDKATGYDAARLAEAKEIIAELKTLKAEWDALPRSAPGGEPLDGDRDEHQGTANNGTQHEGHSGG